MKVRQRVYQPGDRVYYYNPRRLQGKQDKWLQKRSGPFTVVKLIGPANAVIQKSKKAAPMVTHIDKLSPYFEPTEEPQPIVVSVKPQPVHEPLVGDVETDSDELGPLPGHVADEPLRTPRPKRNTRLPARYRD